MYVYIPFGSILDSMYFKDIINNDCVNVTHHKWISGFKMLRAGTIAQSLRKNTTHAETWNSFSSTNVGLFIVVSNSPARISNILMTSGALNCTDDLDVRHSWLTT